MSFVVRSEKKPRLIQNNSNELVGPGKYLGPKETIIPKSFVPFNSSEIRAEKIKEAKLM